MPIYEYVCDDCGHELEALQKMNDLPLTQCPACNKPSLKKKISAAGFRLKGTGWYETDFKNKNNKPATSQSDKKTDQGEKSEKTDKSEKSQTSETKTDTKTSTSEKSTTNT